MEFSFFQRTLENSAVSPGASIETRPMARASRCFRPELATGLALLLMACKAECPTFPAASSPPSLLARAECQVLARVFPELLERQPRGNVVFSPHAATLALVGLAWQREGAERQRLMSVFGAGVSLERLNVELARAEERLKGPPLPDWPEVGQVRPVHFDYESSLSWASNGLEAEPASHAFVQRALTNARREQWSLVTADAIVAGVPWAGAVRTEQRPFAGTPTPFLRSVRGPALGCSDQFDSAAWPAEHLRGDSIPVANPEGRAYVSFARPKRFPASPVAIPALPCHGGELAPRGATIELDFAAPAFCAVSSVELEPALGLATPAGSSATRVVSRLGFDLRGTFNHPERSLPSPQTEHDVQRALRPAALTLEEPFFVTVHDRETGSIIYVAWIREAGVVASCH
jgi:hypothetical protein